MRQPLVLQLLRLPWIRGEPALPAADFHESTKDALPMVFPSAEPAIPEERG
jgi:hypothetical protein